MKLNHRTATLIILVALLFMSIGWSAPVFYASHAPSDHFIEKNSFTTEDTTINSSVHHACFDRTVQRSSTGVITKELYLVPEDGGPPVEVLAVEKDRYFQEGQYAVNIETELPRDVQTGTYRYKRVYTMDLADGRVTRSFAFESETFNITEGPPQDNHNISC